MRRREFLTLLGGAAASPLAARAQQGDRMRRIGVLAGFAENDPRGQTTLMTLLQALQQLGWVDGRNVGIGYRLGGTNSEDLRKSATELVTLGPDVLVATGGSSMGALFQATRSIPIVFANVPDPVGSGFVESLSRPGGNATGFLQFHRLLAGRGGILGTQFSQISGPGLIQRGRARGRHNQQIAHTGEATVRISMLGEPFRTGKFASPVSDLSMRLFAFEPNMAS